MEFIASMDSVICVIVGAAIGWLAGRVMKGFGLLGNVGVGAAGGLIGGLIVDKLDFMDVGDYADPAISAILGSVVALAVAGLYQRMQQQQ